jgi:hypothetical protein
LFRRGEEFQLDGQSHSMRAYHKPNICAIAAQDWRAETLCGATLFLRTPKGGGFQLARFL